MKNILYVKLQAPGVAITLREPLLIEPKGSRIPLGYKKQFKNPLSLPLREGENQ